MFARYCKFVIFSAFLPELYDVHVKYCDLRFRKSTGLLRESKQNDRSIKNNSHIIRSIAPSVYILLLHIINTTSDFIVFNSLKCLGSL